MSTAKARSKLMTKTEAEENYDVIEHEREHIRRDVSSLLGPYLTYLSLSFLTRDEQRTCVIEGTIASLVSVVLRGVLAASHRNEIMDEIVSFLPSAQRFAETTYAPRVRKKSPSVMTIEMAIDRGEIAMNGAGVGDAVTVPRYVLAELMSAAETARRLPPSESQYWISFEEHKDRHARQYAAHTEYVVRTRREIMMLKKKKPTA